MATISREYWTVTVKIKCSNTLPMTIDLYKFTKYDEYQQFVNQYNLFFTAKEKFYEHSLKEFITNQEFCETYIDNYKDDALPWLKDFSNLDIELIKDFCLDVYGKVDTYDFFDFETIHETYIYKKEKIELNCNQKH